jgi:phospholipase/lecithinase/hemolysin
MQTRKAVFWVMLVVAVLTAAVPAANAGAFTAVIAYGDSLSDNGNLFGATGYPPLPYWNGRFSNGPVTVEQMATSLNSPLIDFAWGGATTGLGNVVDGGNQTTLGAFNLPGMLPEVAYSLGSVSGIASTSLFVVWGGANDFFSGGSVSTAVGDMLFIISELQGVGAKHILVPGLPDLGLTPDYYGNPNATAFSVAFNSALLSGLPHGVTYFDTFGVMHQVVANPGAYGLTDVTDPCFNGVTVCGNPDQYLFWDGVHPTTYTDSILAAQFASAVPEPSTLLMLGTAAAGLAGVVRRKLS